MDDDFNLSDNDDVEGEEGESSIEASIHYNAEDFISTYEISDGGTLPHNILEFHHSFGYDCRKRFNLCVADPKTLIFASGNLIHIFNVSSKELKFRRSSTGGGIGHITKNPKCEVLAVGENGLNPPIIVYEWPSFEVITVLQAGTTRSYSHLRFSPDGNLLVSQGGDPDYLITVWDWRRSKVRLQCKSHGLDVYNVVFSRYFFGHMTSCGAGHIKCWKMVETFTGLKLQGELGRFGKTEISDILGVYPMPDEKIISGCEWGNILVWNEGLIKIEVCRKNQKPCHTGYITQFEYINDELVSIGTDGYIRYWYYETIDLAEPTEDSNYCDVEPIYEIRVDDSSNNDTDEIETANAMLLQIIKQDTNSEESTLWYAQDGNGGIWLVDLATENALPPDKLFSCHAGQIVDMDVAAWGPYTATMDADGHMHVYNYLEKSLRLRQKFREKGSCILWLHPSVESSGRTIICGFHTGVIRMVRVNLTAELDSTIPKENENVVLVQAIKPHTKKVVSMKTNPENRVLVTGSEDLTIFVFKIMVTEKPYPDLVPIGFIETPSTVSFMTWKPETSTTLFLGCVRGECVLIDIPDELQDYTKISYKLTRCEPIVFQFESVKSSILREIVRRENERTRNEKIAEKKEELREMIENDPKLEIDEETFLAEADFGEETPLPELYIPEVPSTVLAGFFTPRNTIMILMSGYDAGYIYEYSNPDPDNPAQNVRTELIADCDGKEITNIIFYDNQKFIIFAMEDGAIRVCKFNPEDDTDFSDHWTLTMHDNMNGRIPTMRLSFDKKTLISCGHDGNIFSYIINGNSPPPKVKIPKTSETPDMPTFEVPDIEDLDHPSLEEVIVERESNQIMTDAKEDKENTLLMLRNLNEDYNRIVKRNEMLPESQRLTDADFVIDSRVTEDLANSLKEQMDLVYKQMAYDEEKSKVRLQKLKAHFIEPVTSLPFAVKRLQKRDSMVYSLRELKLTDEYLKDPSNQEIIFDDDLAKSDDKNDKYEPSTALSDVTRIAVTDIDNDEEGYEETPSKVPLIESFLKGLSPRTIQYNLGEEINHMLKKYRALKAKLKEQEHEWKVLMSEKPDIDAPNPEDESIINETESTIGDYKLKATLQVGEDAEKRSTVDTKFREIVECRRKIHFRRENFNERLRAVREKKLKLKEEVEILIKKLTFIHAELPNEFVKPLPQRIILDQDVEFPENNLQLETYTSVADKVKEMKKRKQSIELDVSVEYFDEEYEVLLLDESHFRAERYVMEPKKAEVLKTVRYSVPSDILATLKENENTDSPLERELKRARSTRKQHEQDQILTYVNNCYAALDSELDELEMERVLIVFESVYMNLYLLTMHQEFLIIKKFEKVEKDLTAKVASQVQIIDHINDKMKKYINKIEDKYSTIRKLEEKIKNIVAEYLDSISENKFSAFLEKICKKKRPSNAADDASSVSTWQSHYGEDDYTEDESSEDSEKIKLQTLDESVIPEGCDQEVYDEAFAVRNKRYDLERRIKDELKSIETLQKDQDDQRKKKRTHESELGENRKKLDNLLDEKQAQLNDIDITIILKLGQLQCFIGNNAEKIQNCIVIDKDRLSQLYSRVGELKQETANQLEMHKSDIAHLKKMENDCESMKRELKNVKQEIKKEMEQKFGQQISLIDLYESVLRRLVYEIKANTKSLIKFYDEKIKIIKMEYKQQLRVLNKLIQDNTEKLSFLTVLEDELLKLKKALNAKVVSEEEVCKMETQYGADLEKLKNMLKNQEMQKNLIRDDIRTLSRKSRNLVPIEIKLKTDQGKHKPTLTFDGAEQNLDYQKTCLMRDTINNLGFSGIDDSEYYKKIIAVRHLLAQLRMEEKTNTRETIKMMLEEISGVMRQAGYSQEEIDKSISEIMDVSMEESSKEESDNMSDFIDIPTEEKEDSSEN